MMEALFVIFCIWLLEAGRLGWHGKFRKGVLPFCVHTCSILVIACTFPVDDWLGRGVAILTAAAAGLSHWALWDDAEGNWWSKPLYHRTIPARTTGELCGARLGMPPTVPVSDRWHVLSFLSSWPVEIYALWTLSDPLSGFTSLLWFGAYGALAGSVPFLLWTNLVFEMLVRITRKQRVTQWIDPYDALDTTPIDPVWWYHLNTRPFHWKPSFWRRFL